MCESGTGFACSEAPGSPPFLKHGCSWLRQRGACTCVCMKSTDNTVKAGLFRRATSLPFTGDPSPTDLLLRWNSRSYRPKLAHDQRSRHHPPHERCKVQTSQIKLVLRSQGRRIHPQCVLRNEHRQARQASGEDAVRGKRDVYITDLSLLMSR